MPRRLSTGYPALDGRIDGYACGAVSAIVGGRGSGKTRLLAGLATAAKRNGLRVVTLGHEQVRGLGFRRDGLGRYILSEEGFRDIDHRLRGGIDAFALDDVPWPLSPANLLELFPAGRTAIVLTTDKPLPSDAEWFPFANAVDVVLETLVPPGESTFSVNVIKGRSRYERDLMD